MSGGIAYVWDRDNTFEHRFNDGMADLLPVQSDSEDAEEMKALIENHLKWTSSPVAARVLANWDVAVHQFKKVMPRDYARILREREEANLALVADEVEFSRNGGAVSEPVLTGRTV